MAWNEPGNTDKPKDNTSHKPERDAWENQQKKPNQAPDLDEILNKIKSIFFKNTPQGKPQNQNTPPMQLGSIPIIVIAVLLGLWAASGIYTVEAGNRGLELLFGKYNETTNPGLNWRYPSPIGSHKIINTEKLNSETLDKGGNNDNHMLTKDEAIVDVQIEVQYQITDPKKYWFNVNNPDASLKQIVESAARERVGQTNLDDILTSGRALLMQEVKSLSQTVLDLYGTGLTIVNMNLKDAQPPNAVQSAFSDAIRSREDEQSRRNQADAYDRQVVLEAAGEAAREINNAEAYRDRLIAEATGEASRFNQLYSVYKQAPEVTRTRLYIETMEQVLGKTSKIVMDEQGNNLMVLPLEQILKNNGSTANDNAALNALEKNNKDLNKNEPKAERLDGNPNHSGNNIKGVAPSESASKETRLRIRQ